MTDIKRIHQDEREITAIHLNGDYQSQAYKVGEYGVTKIAPYQESAEYALITFVAVYQGEEIIARFPTINLAIYYRA